MAFSSRTVIRRATFGVCAILLVTAAWFSADHYNKWKATIHLANKANRAGYAYEMAYEPGAALIAGKFDGDGALAGSLLRFRTLYLAGLKVSKEEMGFISRQPLVELNLRGCALESTKELGSLYKIERLDVGWTQVNDATLALLSDKNKLNVLDISGCRITTRGLEYLTGLPQLQELRIDDCDLASDDLWCLSECPALNKLSACNVSIDQACIDHFESRGIAVELSPLSEL